ncbi:L-lactate permease [Streptomyces bathyalis]|uniref:L-lactate permease n=1 Tax=Streptomyces bathyalis TaxID=2710756 RepID=A0A7T1WV66_9ACTN|nr:L-lactate permease [Streptomyces bathyalis]QPP09897.1 L-lactate permease [Streptomyces bathyalis]
MFQPVLDPLGGSLGLSSLVAALPLVVFFVLLGVLRVQAWLSAVAALATSIVVAVAAYGMPVGQSLNSAVLGALFGLFPIMWIVVNALWVYQMTVDTGHFEVLRRSFGRLSDDQRLQAVIVAFCFGALLEALAGFGAPVAISSVMLIALGFKPFKAATVALVANTAPVAFGAMGTPVITLSELTGLPLEDVSSMVGRQTPLLAAVVPVLLVYLVDGKRGVRQTWWPALACGLSFAVAQFVCSNYMSVELTDVVAALVSVGVLVLVMRMATIPSPAPEEISGDEPDGSAPAGGDAAAGDGSAAPGGTGAGSGGAEPATQTKRTETVTDPDGETRDSTRAAVNAYLPYIVIIVVFALTKLPAVKTVLEEKGTALLNWPGLHVADPVSGKPAASTVFKFDWLPATGTMLLLSGVITAVLLAVSPRVATRAYGRTLHQLRWAILTVATVLALAYVMNLSGQTSTIGNFIAGAGAALAFLSPVLGWLGVAVTGSDTSANALFGILQVTAAKNSGYAPELLAAANSSGGVLGKMLSPQNLAIAAAATGLGGREPELLRKVVGWSLVLLLLMCVLVFLQSTSVLGWMLLS